MQTEVKNNETRSGRILKIFLITTNHGDALCVQSMYWSAQKDSEYITA